MLPRRMRAVNAPRVWSNDQAANGTAAGEEALVCQEAPVPNDLEPYFIWKK
jgi:hypothetical protein